MKLKKKIKTWHHVNPHHMNISGMESFLPRPGGFGDGKLQSGHMRLRVTEARVEGVAQNVIIVEKYY